MATSAVTMYRCEENGKLYDSLEKAKAASRRHKARVKREEERLKAEQEARVEMQRRSEYVRLNATSSAHALELIAAKAKEYWDLDVRVDYDPKGRKDIPLESRWSMDKGKLFIGLGTVRISMSYEGKSNPHLERIKKEKGEWGITIDNLLFDPSYGGFSGFKTGSGSSGLVNRSPGVMEISLIFDQFPLIIKRHGKWEEHKSKYIQSRVDQRNIMSYANALLVQDPQFTKLSQIEGYYTQCLDEVKTAKANLANYYLSSLSDLHSRHYPPYEIPHDLQNQFGN